MRVLLIEDEQRLAENIVSALRETGLAVDHAPDGETGSHLAEQGVYDAIVLDLMLPGKSGQRVLHDLRRGKFSTPVLVLTAQEGKESIVELLNAGADDYLSKPFDLGRTAREGEGADPPRQRAYPPRLLTLSDVALNTVQQTVRSPRPAISSSLADGVSHLRVPYPPAACRRLQAGAARTPVRLRLGASLERDRSAHLQPPKETEPARHGAFD